MIAPRDRPGGRAIRRAMAVAAALSAVLGQFFALWHEIGVRHVRCAEHGELTHVAASAGVRVARFSAGPAVRAGEADAAVRHDHCTATFSPSAAPVSSAPRTSAQVPARAAGALPRPGAPARDRAFLLAYAPKTSPPSV